MSPKKDGKEQNSGAAEAPAGTLNAAALAELLQQQGGQGGDISQLLLLQRKQQLLQQQQLPQLSPLDTFLMQSQGQNAAGLQLLLQQQQGELDQLLSRARLEQQQQQLQLASLLSGNAQESTNVRFSSDEVKQEKKGDGEPESKPSSPVPEGKKKNDDQDDEKAGVASAGDGADEENPEDLENDTFPFKLFRMLAKVEEDGKQDIVSFTSNNRAFIIHKPHKFTNEIMPEYFTTTRMSSFQRQLNLYGFRRITEGPNKGAYYHEFFQKGKLSWCNRIKRKKNSVKSPPNFFGALAPTFAGLPGGIAPALTVRQMLADPSGLMGLQAAGLGGMGMVNPAALNLGALGQPNNNLATVLALQQQKEQVEALQQLLLNQQRQQQR